MSTPKDEELARQRARNEEVGQAGKLWLEQKRAEIDALPVGTVVIFNVATGEYVTGLDYLVASDDFHRTFGEEMPGFVHRVGRPVFVGGGLFGGGRA